MQLPETFQRLLHEITKLSNIPILGKTEAKLHCFSRVDLVKGGKGHAEFTSDYLLQAPVLLGILKAGY